MRISCCWLFILQAMASDNGGVVYKTQSNPSLYSDQPALEVFTIIAVCIYYLTIQSFLSFTGLFTGYMAHIGGLLPICQSAD